MALTFIRSVFLMQDNLKCALPVPMLEEWKYDIAKETTTCNYLDLLKTKALKQQVN